jgi:hypothetical protein
LLLVAPAQKVLVTPLKFLLVIPAQSLPRKRF